MADRPADNTLEAAWTTEELYLISGFAKVAARAGVEGADEIEAKADWLASRVSAEPTEDTLAEALRAARRERDEVYAVNAAANYDRANAAEEALREIEALCEPERIPLPKLNSMILRIIRPALAASRGVSAENKERITHGRHCICSACAQEDWANPNLAPCGMHGSSCPRVYAPWGAPGSYAAVPVSSGDA